MSSAQKDEIVAKLHRVRQALTETVAAFTAAQWETAVYSSETETIWTVADMFRHVVDAERSMTSLMKQIQKGSTGVPEDFDLARWNKRRIEKTGHLTPADLMQNMRQHRQALLQFINTLQPEDWQKKGRHGSRRILSITQICHLIADHEQSHTAEMQKAAKN